MGPDSINTEVIPIWYIFFNISKIFNKLYLSFLIKNVLIPQEFKKFNFNLFFDEWKIIVLFDLDIT